MVSVACATSDVNLVYGPAVDIVTILPTFITFIIRMIGDIYPLPESQTGVVEALQVTRILALHTRLFFPDWLIS